MPVDPLAAGIQALVVNSGLERAPVAIQPVSGGGNNRVFQVTCGTRRLIAKCYFRDVSDTRDRLGTEWGFLSYACEIGLDCVPQPVAIDVAAGIALYEFIDGRKLTTAELTSEHIAAAARFFLQLNQPAHRPRGAALPAASEACFSITGHLELLDARVARLAGVASLDAVSAEAARFAGVVAATWQETRAAVLAAARKLGLDPAAQLAPAQRCISPSDFGFHNALLRTDGRLAFLDFEYAGWDDPAKTLADFFCQPGVPVPERFREPLISSTMTYSEDAAAMRIRAELLEPVFRTKWVCIMLNQFLPDAAKRRRFADPGQDEQARKQAQLDRARSLHETLNLSTF